MTISWVSVEATSGTVIADLPTLKASGPLRRTIGRHETQSAVLPLDEAPPNWRTATRKKAVFLVAIDENETPLWGGMVTERTTTHKDGATLSMATAEDYFNDRYVGDESFKGVAQNTIVRTLVEKYAKDGAVPGINIRVVELPGANPTRDRTYENSSDKTLFTALDELRGLDGGPEWTVDWERISGGKYGMILYVGGRIGSPAPDGLGPAAQFFLPGSVQNASVSEGYRRGEGANSVMATSSGAAGARPQSAPAIYTSDGRPRIEYRWSPATSITVTGTLDSHAQRALAAMKRGSVALSITANTEDAPRLGSTWNIGDDIGFDLTSPAWPNGVVGTARAIGVEITENTVTPVLDATGIEGIA